MGFPVSGHLALVFGVDEANTSRRTGSTQRTENKCGLSVRHKGGFLAARGESFSHRVPPERLINLPPSLF